MNRSSLAVAPSFDHLSHKRDGSFKVQIGQGKYIYVSEYLHNGLHAITRKTKSPMLGALLQCAEEGMPIIVERQYVDTNINQNLLAALLDERFTHLLLATVEAMQAKGWTFSQAALAVYELGIKAGRPAGWRNLEEENND